MEIKIKMSPGSREEIFYKNFVRKINIFWKLLPKISQDITSDQLPQKIPWIETLKSCLVSIFASKRLNTCQLNWTFFRGVNNVIIGISKYRQSIPLLLTSTLRHFWTDLSAMLMNCEHRGFSCHSKTFRIKDEKSLINWIKFAIICMPTFLA